MKPRTTKEEIFIATIRYKTQIKSNKHKESSLSIATVAID